MTKNIVIFAIVLAIVHFSCFADSHSEANQGKQVHLILTEGIVGGIVPAHIRFQAVVVPSEGKHLVFVKNHTPGSKALYSSGDLASANLEKLIADISSMGLWDLPIESPEGCEDIYGMDTSIAIHDGSNFWRNGGPGGCIHGQSKVKANEKQIKTFRKISLVVKRNIEIAAKNSATQQDFDKALQEARTSHGR